MAQPACTPVATVKSSTTTESQNCYHDEFIQLMNSGEVIIIEVRRPDEIEKTGMMDAAHHIPLDQLEQAFELPDEEFKRRYGFDRPKSDGSDIIFTCRSGRRSGLALQIAQKFGYNKSRHYVGGWLTWTEKNNL